MTIDGRVEGTVKLGDHGLTIGSNAKIHADIVAKTVTVRGAVTGTITAGDKVVISAGKQGLAFNGKLAAAA